MDSGVWSFFLMLIPVVCVIIVASLLFILLSNKVKKKNIKVLLIIMIILFFMPIANVILTNISNVFNISNFANVENIEFNIEKLSDSVYNFYFFDKEGYYYTVKKESYNNQFENNVYLNKESSEKYVGLKLDLNNIKCEKVYMCDYLGHKILIWNIDSNNLENSYE